MKQGLGAVFLVSVVLFVAAFLGVASATTNRYEVAQYSSLRQALKDIKLPPLKNPDWLEAQLAAAKAAQSQTVTYTVTTRGSIQASFDEFRLQANQTLNDNRGWSRMGINFKEVTSGGQFVLVLSEASQVPSFSSGCSADWSCNAGQYVIINQDRWLGASTSWNTADGSLRDYRHMVVNHETGHWLGHGHEDCSGIGQSAAVMQQQSINLQGCQFNPWPLAGELWSTRLGIS